MTFAAAWLALREPFDHAARAASLSGELRGFLQRRQSEPLRIIDLACGSGSGFRYLAPRLGGSQRWTMVDNDPALLALLPGGLGEPDSSDSSDSSDVSSQSIAKLAPVCCDLMRDLQRLPFSDADVVTASALLDLVSEDWLQRLLEQLVPGRTALLFALSYDGSMNWEPALPDDGRMTDWFNLHQRTDKGFGAALGPDAVARAARRLRTAGFDVTMAASDWHFGVDDQAIQREVAAGVAGAAAALPSARADNGGSADAVAAAWLAARRELIDAGVSTLRVGHNDLLALPVKTLGR